MERKITPAVTAVAVALGIVLFLAGCAPSANDEGGFSGEGHGGNPSVKAKLDDAKKVAPRVLRDLTDEQVSSVENPKVRKFLERRETWAADIERSAHDWPSTEAAEEDRLALYPPHLRERAAVTAPRMASDIRFSWTIAEKVVLSLDEAVDILLHESAHHLEQTDEAFVKLTVAEVMRLWKRTRRPDPRFLRSALCDRLADYYLLLTPTERSVFSQTCATALTLKINQVQKVPPYDAVTGVDVSFGFSATLEDVEDREPIFPVREFQIHGIANLSRMEGRATQLEDAWRVVHLSVHSENIRDELNEFFTILDDKPLTVAELMRRGDPRISIIGPEYRSSVLVYDSAFPYALDMDRVAQARSPVITDGAQLIVFVSATGKWWPIAYTEGTALKAPYSDHAVIQTAAVPVYTTARLVSPFIDKEPGAELSSFRTARYKPEMLTVNWNHLAFLGPGRFDVMPYSAAGMNISEQQVQDALRKLRMAPVLVPELNEFEALVKDLDQKLISLSHSMEDQPVLKAELREIYAQYFLRRARVKQGDGVLAFLNYVGSNKDILRYGLTREELRFLVLRGLDTYLRTAHSIPVAGRRSSFEENLELLGWRFETLEVTPQQVEEVVRRDKNLGLKFYFYDEAQALMKRWREDACADELGLDWVLQRYMLDLEREVGLTASELGITPEVIQDSVRVASLIEAYRILESELLPKMKKEYRPTSKDLGALAYWATRFRTAVGRSFYTAEYLYVGKDPFRSVTPESNQGSQIDMGPPTVNSPSSGMAHSRRIIEDAAKEVLGNMERNAILGESETLRSSAGGAIRKGAQTFTVEMETLLEELEHPLQPSIEHENLVIGTRPRRVIGAP
ncbi:MAG: hypothetical protein KDD51_05145 [Bdellovibrionales bacterium]|nr:hypothetical protein [Bdellovibrionales bacterium]